MNLKQAKKDYLDYLSAKFGAIGQELEIAAEDFEAGFVAGIEASTVLELPQQIATILNKARQESEFFSAGLLEDLLRKLGR